MSKTSYEQAKEDAGGCFRFIVMANLAIFIVLVFLVILSNCAA